LKQMCPKHCRSSKNV